MEPKLSHLLDQALQHIPDPKVGLPQEAFYFVSQLSPMVSVELLIKNKNGQTLLTWRDDGFHGPGWHLPGGIIRFKENIEDRIAKVAESELGCGVSFADKPIDVRGIINTERDIRGHFITLLYLCELDGLPDSAKQLLSLTPEAGQWAWHDLPPPNLIKVHEVYRYFINEVLPL